MDPVRGKHGECLQSPVQLRGAESAESSRRSGHLSVPLEILFFLHCHGVEGPGCVISNTRLPLKVLALGVTDMTLAADRWLFQSLKISLLLFCNWRFQINSKRKRKGNSTEIQMSAFSGDHRWKWASKASGGCSEKRNSNGKKPERKGRRDR